MRNEVIDHPKEQEQRQRPNKSAAKRAMQQLVSLAQKLADMPEPQFARIKVDDDLRQDIVLARQTKGHGSRKRQIKHLAGVLRRNETESQRLQDIVEGTGAQHQQQVDSFHALESLRDRLCAADTRMAALAEIGDRWPQLDRAAVETQAVRAEKGGDRTAYRRVFRLLKQAQDQAEQTP